MRLSLEWGVTVMKTAGELKKGEFYLFWPVSRAKEKQGRTRLKNKERNFYILALI